MKSRNEWLFGTNFRGNGLMKKKRAQSVRMTEKQGREDAWGKLFS